MNLREKAGGQLLSSKLSVRLLGEIRTGQYAGFTQLPSEVELAGTFGVSRTVVRDALSSLEREGIIERMRGLGTVIHRNVVGLKCRLDMKLEYNQIIRDLGYEAQSDRVTLKLLQAEDDIAKKLEIPPGAPVVMRQKRVLASGTPVIHSTDYLAQELLDLEDYKAIDWSCSIFDILMQYCCTEVQSSITHVKAVMGTPEQREMLVVKEHEALMRLEELGFAKLGRPVLLTEAYYTDFFDFSLLRKIF